MQGEDLKRLARARCSPALNSGCDGTPTAGAAKDEELSCGVLWVHKRVRNDLAHDGLKRTPSRCSLVYDSRVGGGGGGQVLRFNRQTTQVISFSLFNEGILVDSEPNLINGHEKV